MPSLSVRANLCVEDRVRRFGLRWPKDGRSMATPCIDRFSVRPSDTEVRIGALSGGNKVVIARALEGHAGYF